MVINVRYRVYQVKDGLLKRPKGSYDYTYLDFDSIEEAHSRLIEFEDYSEYVILPISQGCYFDD